MVNSDISHKRDSYPNTDTRYNSDISDSMSVYKEINCAALYLISGKWLYSPTGPDLVFINMT